MKPAPGRENPNDTTITSGYSFYCEKCEATHLFTAQDYDKTTGGVALTYLFRQLPSKYRNNQFLVPLQTIQQTAMIESFNRHYKHKDNEKAITTKLVNKLKNADGLKNIYSNLVVPKSTNTDWNSVAGPKDNLNDLKYIEPDQVPKELLYKFNQCLRKKTSRNRRSSPPKFIKQPQ